MEPDQTDTAACAEHRAAESPIDDPRVAEARRLVAACGDQAPADALTILERVAGLLATALEAPPRTPPGPVRP